MSEAIDFDPTFEIDPEDFADMLDDLSNSLGRRGRYEDASTAAGGAKWIRRLAALERVERETA